jgi:hypothetical protein
MFISAQAYVVLVLNSPLEALLRVLGISVQIDRIFASSSRISLMEEIFGWLVLWFDVFLIIDLLFEPLKKTEHVISIVRLAFKYSDCIKCGKGFRLLLGLSFLIFVANSLTTNGYLAVENLSSGDLLDIYDVVYLRLDSRAELVQQCDRVLLHSLHQRLDAVAFLELVPELLVERLQHRLLLLLEPVGHLWGRLLSELSTEDGVQTRNGSLAQISLPHLCVVAVELCGLPPLLLLPAAPHSVPAVRLLLVGASMSLPCSLAN